jgi:VWFA-related protein
MLRKSLLVALPLGASLVLAQETAPPPASQETVPSPASQEAAPPTFPGEVEQVTVDAVVLDEKGVPIKGLGKEDFEVFEDGVRQEVVNFEAIEVPPAPSTTPRPRPRISTNQEKENTAGRTFVVLFDDMHLTPAMAQRAKGAVADFLAHGVREGDRVTLVATLAGTWWTTRMEAGRDELIALLKKLDGRYIPDNTRERMTDYEAKRIHMDRDIDLARRVARRYAELGVAPMQNPSPQQSRYFATSIDPYLMSRAAEFYVQSTVRTRTTLAILERSLEALNATRGRKTLILVSAGFIWDTNLEEFREVARAARRSNTVVYFVNARGLEGMPHEMTAEFGAALPEIDLGFTITDDFWEAEGAETIATNSGGFIVRDTNDLSAGFERIAEENSSYYLLGYNPTNTTRDGAFRQIEVELPGRKKVQIRARKGYYAPSDDEDTGGHKKGVDPVFQEALDSPYEMTGIPLRMTHFVGEETILGKARVEVVTEVDLRALDLEPQGGRYLGGLDFLLVAAHRESGEFFRYDQKVGLKLLPATRDRLRKTWFPIRREFELRPGGYQAKIVVRDERSGRVATVVHRFEVPDLTEFRVSTPVLTDSRQEGGESEEQILPVARREFEKGEELFCRLEVYGAQKDDSGMPRVDMGYVVRRVDGDVLKGIAPTEIRPTSLGKLSRSFGFGLQAAQPGDYELVMIFYDHLSGKKLELKEPFSVLDEGGLERASARTGG